METTSMETDALLTLIADDAVWWPATELAFEAIAVDLQGADPAKAPSKKKHKKRPGRTARDEILSLRRAVSDLEALLSLRSRREAAGSPQRGSGGRALSMWKGVATRQLQLLRQAQHENESLRDQMKRQSTLLARMRRLVDRLRVPEETVPSVVMSVHAQVFAQKRRALLATVAAAQSSVEATSATLSSRLRRDEFCETESFTQAGAVLTRNCAGRLVPCSNGRVAQALWEYLAQYNGVSLRHCNVEHVERGINSLIVGFNFSFPTEHGLALYHGLSVRTRTIDAKRDTVISVGSVWPDASTPSPFDAVGFNALETIVFQPHTSTREVAGVVDEVLMHWVLCPLEESKPMTREQTSTLDSFVIKVREYMVNDIQQFLDSALLRQA